MARINPYSLKRPAPLVESRTFTDSAQPGVELALTLKSDGSFDEMVRIGERTRQITEDFVTGRVRPPAREGEPLVVEEPPAPISLPGIGVFQPSETLARVVAGLMVLQVTTDGEAPYDFAEWCALSVVLPSAFAGAVEWAAELMGRARTGPASPAKNAPGASAGQPSAPPSTTD